MPIQLVCWLCAPTFPMSVWQDDGYYAPTPYFNAGSYAMMSSMYHDKSIF